MSPHSAHYKAAFTAEEELPPPSLPATGLDVARLLQIQRDLAAALVACADLQECLAALLAAALQLPDLDCGGAYLLDEDTGDLNLTTHSGLSETFISQIRHRPATSDESGLVRERVPYYSRAADFPPFMAALLQAEGLSLIAVFPLSHQGHLVGAVNLATHHAADLPPDVRLALESMVELTQVSISAIHNRQVRRKSERTLTLAVAAADLGVWQADLNTRRIEASPRTRELHGLASGESLTFESLGTSIHPDDLEPFLTRVREAIAGTGSFALEYRLADGRRWIAAQACYYADPSPHFIGIVHDVTSRKLVEAERLAASQQLEDLVTERTAALAAQSSTLELAMDASGAGHWQLDLTTGNLELDRRCRILFGYDNDAPATLEQCLASRIHPESREALAQHLQEVSLPGGPEVWDHEFKIIHPACGERWIHGMGRIMRSPKGHSIRMTGINLDVTHHKQAESLLRNWNQSLEQQVAARTRELRASEARFKSLAEATFEGIVISRDGIVTDINPQGASMFGYQPSEVIGRPNLDFVAPPSLQSITDYLRAGSSHTMEWTGLRKDGSTFPVESQARNQLMNGEQLRVASLRDLTTAKQATAQIEAQRAELETTRRLALISEISAGIIHQISQPLSAAGSNISIAAAKLAAGAPLWSTALPLVEDVQADISRMTDIVVHLRSLATPARPQPVPAQLNQAVHGVLPMLRQEAGARGITLSTALAPDLPPTSIDLVQLQQVVINLARNGIAACSEISRDQHSVHISTRQLPDQRLELVVRDSGPGLTPEVENRLFTPFFSTKSGGAGIGLRLCQTIIHAHHGSIEGTNNPDTVGACFRIVLPLDREPLY